MLSVLEARESILSRVKPLGPERVPVLDAMGRITAETIPTRRLQPPWDNSAMDGYALRAADVVDASDERPVCLEVIEDVMAGSVPRREVGQGQATRIMTGAPIPRGADAVVRVEKTRSPGPDRVEVMTAVPIGNDIRRAGEDHRPGDVLVEAGREIRPAEVGLISAAPRTWIKTIRPPTVAILSTGDELTEPDQAPGPGQIVNTNVYALAAMVKESGGHARILPIAGDTREATAALFEAARGADVILSSGGVSVGAHDFVKEVLEDLGVKMAFWKVKMTPGKPLAFGLWDKAPVFGLPGNPVSSMVSFELFVRPALLKMAGHTRIYRRAIRARLEEDTRKRPAMVHFIRVKLRQIDGIWHARSTGPQGSGILRSMSLADGLAVGLEGLDVMPAGDDVWVLPLDARFGTSDERPV